MVAWQSLQNTVTRTSLYSSGIGLRAIRASIWAQVPADAVTDTAQRGQRAREDLLTSALKQSRCMVWPHLNTRHSEVELKRFSWHTGQS